MRVIVIGCGRVGSGLARRLVQQQCEVPVVDVDAAAFEALGSDFAGPCIRGTGIDRHVLERAGVERADGLAAVTGSDDVNAVVARLATHVFHIPRVVARLYDPHTADVYERLGIRTISPVSWGIHRLTELLTFAEVMPVTTVGTGGVELVEAHVPPLLAGRPPSEIAVPSEIEVVAVSRRGRTFLVTPDIRLEEGDLVHVLVASRSMARLESLLGYG